MLISAKRIFFCACFVLCITNKTCLSLSFARDLASDITKVAESIAKDPQDIDLSLTMLAASDVLDNFDIEPLNQLSDSFYTVFLRTEKLGLDDLGTFSGILFDILTSDHLFEIKPEDLHTSINYFKEQFENFKLMLDAFDGNVQGAIDAWVFGSIKEREALKSILKYDDPVSEIILNGINKNNVFEFTNLLADLRNHLLKLVQDEVTDSGFKNRDALFEFFSAISHLDGIYKSVTDILRTEKSNPAKQNIYMDDIISALNLNELNADEVSKIDKLPKINEGSSSNRLSSGADTSSSENEDSGNAPLEQDQAQSGDDTDTSQLGQGTSSKGNLQTKESSGNNPNLVTKLVSYSADEEEDGSNYPDFLKEAIDLLSEKFEFMEFFIQPDNLLTVDNIKTSLDAAYNQIKLNQDTSMELAIEIIVSIADKFVDYDSLISLFDRINKETFNQNALFEDGENSLLLNTMLFAMSYEMERVKNVEDEDGDWSSALDKIRSSSTSVKGAESLIKEALGIL